MLASALAVWCTLLALPAVADEPLPDRFVPIRSKSRPSAATTADAQPQSPSILVIRPPQLPKPIVQHTVSETNRSPARDPSAAGKPPTAAGKPPTAADKPPTATGKPPRAVGESSRPAVPQATSPSLVEVEEEQFKSISELNLRIGPPAGTRPDSTADAVFASKGTVYPPEGFFFECLQHSPYGAVAPFGHHPLYFEEVCLERYGKRCSYECLQPLVSAAHFYASIAALPYKMHVDPPCRKVCSHCRYRGDQAACCCQTCSETLCERFEWDAALFEAAVIGGLILAIP